MVIPHADIILHLFILASWDIHRVVIMVGRAFCVVTRIPLIRFDFFLSFNYRHGGWCQDNACDIMLCQLVVQGIAQASCLITAYKRYIFPPMQPSGKQERKVHVYNPPPLYADGKTHLSQLNSNKVKKFLCERPFLRKLWYYTFVMASFCMR
jgi:hypothetical protein